MIETNERAGKNIMASAREPAPSLVFSHFGLYCSDFPAMRDFYTRVFGFAVSDVGHRANGTAMAFMTRRPFEHHQLVLASNRPEDAASTINQLGFTAKSLGELRRIEGLLAREDGATDLVAVDHGISWTIYFLDPCQNRVAVSVDTGWYVPQPACWPLDLSRADADIAAVTERNCRATQGFKTRPEWRRELESRLNAEGTLSGQATPEIEAAPPAPGDASVFKFEAGEEAPPAQPYPDVAMSSIGLYATDLARLETFYADVLGYAVTGKGRIDAIGSAPASDCIYLTRDPDQFAQIVLCAGRAAATPSSVQQLTFRLPSFDELRHADKMLRAADGVTKVVNTCHGNSFSIYCEDPEGNRLELSKESEWYIPAPISWPLDLSLSDDEILVQTEAKCRETDGFMMRADWKARARAELTSSGRLEAE